ncbi:MAG TPA: class I SAM-dependent methyltransferase [Candidatus Acidoferrales bacterium]|nr:class I SAM-dependent methyltransferase [Candidatus Acidoferrales bacterium]
MQEPLAKLLCRLEAEGAANDARETERRNKLLNLERATAELVALFVRSSARRNVLEIGTSNGYSTLWLADSLSHMPGAKLTTIEREAAKQGAARENLASVGLSHIVDFRLGDATEIVRELSGPFDCAFFDADRVSAPQQLEILVPRLTPQALLLADNALSHPDEIDGYRKFVEQLPNVVWSVVPVGKGLHVAWLE